MGNLHLVTGFAGQAHVMAADQASLHAAIFGAGQGVTNRGNQFAAEIVTNNQIRVLDGDIMMQGRHVRLNEGTYVDLAIENGEQGKLRNDLIVARYTKDAGTGVEECNLIVLKGTAVDSDPADPEYTAADIINDHVLVADMPLYRVPIDGLNVQPLVALFSAVKLHVSLEDVGAAAADHTHTAADVGAAAASHNQAASTITAGTLAGQVVANGTAVATLGTAQVRNIYAGTSDLTAGSSSLTTGAIYFVYE